MLKQTRSTSIKKYGSNYYRATLLLPDATRDAVHLLYAYVRRADNIVDQTDITADQAVQQLTHLQNDFHHSRAWIPSQDSLTQEYVDLCHTYQFPVEWTDAFYRAMLADSHTFRYTTYIQLQQYMYGSAEVIWLMLCKIFWVSEQATHYARKLWEAMQYTNFLRDIAEDYHHYGRIYLPTKRLEQFWLSHQEIIAFCEWTPVNAARKAYMTDECRFAHELYRQAEPGIAMLPRKTQHAVRLAAKLYESILDKIKQIWYDQFTYAARTSKSQKAAIILRYVWTQLRSVWATLWKLSRPRFWLYLIGPRLVGWAATGEWLTSFVSREFLIGVAYFSFPANLMLYGINDIYDTATDLLNPKKDHYELRLSQQFHPTLIRTILLTNLPFLIYRWWESKWWILFTLIAFLIVSRSYSAPPARWKARPLLDSLSNLLYILPGILAFGIAGGEQLSVAGICAAILRAMAMHTYSAIPDIQADMHAQITTTAVRLGKLATLIYCWTLWLLSALIAYQLLGVYALIWAIVYLTITILTRWHDSFELYQRFPLINALYGMGLFRWIIYIT